MVRPATTGVIENTFTGIVGGVSKATTERMLQGIGQRGASVPPQSAPIISDPVRREISEAEISLRTGPLPKAPEPVEIEVLANPSAGQSASGPVHNISMGIVQGASQATSERLSPAAGARGAHLSPEVAAVVGNPVRAEVTKAAGRFTLRQRPVAFFLAFLANLSVFAGAAAIFFGVTAAAERLVSRGMRLSRAGLWTVRLLLGLLYAALVAGAELLVAFGVVGVEHEAGTQQVFLFLTLAIASVVAMTLLFMAVLDPAGIGWLRCSALF